MDDQELNRLLQEWKAPNAPPHLRPPRAHASRLRCLISGTIRVPAPVAIAALLVLFMLQNTDDVHVELLWWDLTWPLWLIVLLSAALGAFVWLGLGVIRRHRRRKERREERRD